MIYICSPIYDFNTNSFTIGGIQTYIYNLAEVFIKNNYDVTILMLKKEYKDYKEAKINNIIIKQIPGKRRWGIFSMQKTFNYIYNEYNSFASLFIIDTDQRDIRSKANNVITIQHGVAFDIPGDMIKGIWGKNTLLQRFNKLLRCLKNVNRLSYTKNCVLVDYNYFNWYRTLGTIKTNIKIILNFSSGNISKEELIKKQSNIKTPLNIIFARRFVDYRGTTIFKKVVERLFKEGYDFNVTFAGNGPLLNTIKEYAEKEPRISVISFDSKESIDVHKLFDVAVIPTLFSEGTSLSLCEAMCAGCVPVATYVGGMSNMIINRHNGFLCYPSEESLYECMKEILSLDKLKLIEISSNAYDVGISTFSRLVWEKEWIDFTKKTLQTS